LSKRELAPVRRLVRQMFCATSEQIHVRRIPKRLRIILFGLMKTSERDREESQTMGAIFLRRERCTVEIC